ncbi:Uncharacterised protein [Mycobacterium tuberculosis]|nr:Uncharacterised protein [Mycobacterium tuberculosis]
MTDVQSASSTGMTIGGVFGLESPAAGTPLNPLAVF